MRTRTLRLGLVVGLLSSALAAPGSALALDDVGVEGPSYAGASADPTGEKPESKAWFNDGAWWASLWDTASSRYEIFRFNASTQTWASTNLPLDTRKNSRADALWDGAKLYVASHVFSKSPAAGYPSNLWRFSYDPATDTYSLDTGWPQQINNQRSETLVIDKDSTGQLWATWVQGGSGSREVWVNRTTSGDSTWGTPFKPFTDTLVANDDISSLVAFGGNQIGLFWSNQRGASFHFAVHGDTAADTTWGSSVFVYQGAGNADDHINLKSLQTDGSGRVFAVIKTSKTGTNPSIVLLVRSNTAVWSAHTIWTGSDGLTRPIVLLDTSNNRIHAFASEEGGGPVYTKTSSMSSIAFSAGLGTTVMLDASHNNIDNATSTKQNLTSASGLLVLASNESTDHYWHHFDSLGGGGGGSAPVANFTATPTSGEAPLAVSFTDTSTNSPTAWAWDFTNDGSTDSTAQHPSHSYTAAGTFTVKLTATNAGGSDSETKTGYITVSEPGGGGGETTVVPVADAYVRSDSPSTNTGAASTLRARKTSSLTIDSYLKFTVSGVGAVSAATLRLFVSEGSVDGGAVHAVADSSWTETGITWSNRPTPGGMLADIGAVSSGTWVELDVSDLVSGDGTYSLAVLGAVSDVVNYHSREATNDPQLVLTPSGGGGGGSAPVANFSATPTSGEAPLAVDFTDTSTNTPTEWAWDFTNDGSTDSTAQHPSFTYSAAGSYTVSLTASNDDGSDTETKTHYTTVSEPGGGGGLTVNPSDDTYVSSSSPTAVNGNANNLRVRDSSTQLHSYLKFSVSGAGSPTSATLRLFVTEPSVDGGSLYLVPDSSWSESSMTWNTREPTSGSALDTAGTASTGTWVEFDVSGVVTGDGTYSFALISAANDVVRYASSEHATTANRPQLVVGP